MKDYPTTNTEELKRWTALLEAFFLCIAEAAQRYQKPYYFGGGIAIDLTFGGLTRSHADGDAFLKRWRWFAEGSVGCVGILRDGLVDAVTATLAQGETSLTEAVLTQTMPHPPGG